METNVEKLTKKERADERRALHIMSSCAYYGVYEMSIEEKREHQLESLLRGGEFFPYHCTPFIMGKARRDTVFVYRHYMSKGLTVGEVGAKWRKIQRDKQASRKDWEKMPKPERKDNQNPATDGINYGSGGGNGGRIRIPSRKHKNRFKNFLKLFPHLKDKFN